MLNNATVDEYIRKNPIKWMDYPELENIKQNSLKYERKHIEILHPYACYGDNSHHRNKIKVLFKGETFNGVPHGLCYVEYVHEGNRYNDIRSFVGGGMMMHGQFHRGSALFVGGDGQRYSFSSMINGRPNGFGKVYRPEGHQSNVVS